MKSISLAVATVLSGLSAGLLYGWWVSVIPGTRRMSGSSYVETMQSVNQAILNPAFLAVFLGAPVAIAVAGVVTFIDGESLRTVLLVTALLLYLSTTLATTVRGNIPLNDQLEQFELSSATPTAIGDARDAYEGPWNRLHGVRVASSTLAFALCVAATLVNVG